MNYQRVVLKNGLRIIVVPIKEVESATTMVLVGAGSRYENRNNNGISHFLEHMAFKGTKKRPTALEIASLVDGIGAEQNAFTGKELTGYYIKSSKNHVDLALDVISDMLSNSILLKEEIDKERGVILEEINLYEDTPARKIGDIFERLLYGDSPMGWDIAGEKDVIRAIKREDFTAYMGKLYSANNMCVIVAGNIDTNKTLQLVEKYFSPLISFDIESYSKVVEDAVKSDVLIKHKKTEQAHFGLGIITTGLQNEKDRYPLTILSSILGGGMSSRLFHEIRERRGLAYYVRTISENYLDTGYLSTFAGVDPKRIDQAIEVVVKEYKKILEKGDITEKELIKAKEYVKGHFILELEDTRSVAGFYGSDELLENKLENPQDVVEKINKITLEDVNLIVTKYFTDAKLNLAVIGDFEDRKRFDALIS